MGLSNLTFSSTWSESVKRFGASFWPLIGLTALFGIVSVVISVFGIGVFFFQIFNINEEGFALANSVSIYAVVMLVITVLAAVGVAIGQQAALIVRVNEVHAVGQTITIALKRWWPLLLNGLLVGLVTGIPLLVGAGLTAGAYFWHNVAIGITSGVIILASCVWAAWFSILSSFSPFFVVLENSRPIEAIKKSISMVRPVGLKVFGYLLLMGIIIGLASAALGTVPFIGSFAATLITTPWLVVFQFVIFRTVREAIPATTSLPTNSPAL